MLIRFFRSSFIAQYFTLVLIAVALWVPAFNYDARAVMEASPVTPLYNLVLSVLPSIAWLYSLLGLLIVLGSALILNNVFIFHDLAPKNSLLPALLLILFFSSAPETLSFYPALLALLPVSFFFHQSCRLYDNYENPNNVLALGILASLCSMVYFPAILLILFTWLLFLLYRIINWRQWAISLLGFVLPYLYLVVYYFWMDTLAGYSGHYIAYLEGVFDTIATPDLFQIAIWVIFVLLMLLPAIVRTISTLGSQNITFRRKMAATIWMAIFWAATLALQGDITLNTLIYIPAAGIIATHFHAMKRSAWNELVLLAYMILIGVHNYMII